MVEVIQQQKQLEDDTKLRISESRNLNLINAIKESSATLCTILSPILYPDLYRKALTK